MIIDKIGDILHTEADVICHQVNCKWHLPEGYSIWGIVVLTSYIIWVFYSYIR